MTETRPGGQIAKFVDYQPRLFEFYQRFRYNELVCDELMRGSIKVERWVRGSVLVSVVLSGLTGSFAFLRDPALASFWALFTIVSLILSLYSLIIGSGTKQVHWFGMAEKFRNSASNVEIFTESVRMGHVMEGELLTKWGEFVTVTERLLDQAGFELRDFSSRNGIKMEKLLKDTLTREHKL